MADVLNRCINCKCCLTAGDKPSKLLPCLHAMCEDCITGKTDAMEKQKLLTAMAVKNEEKVSPGDKPSDRPSDVGHETEADHSEAKVSKEECNMKKTEDDGDKIGDSMDKIKDATEETSKEETPPDPVPLKECTVCKEPFNADTVIDNVFIRKMTATASESEPGELREQKCTGCDLNPAAAYCMQCDDWLCSDCVSAHKIVRMTKDHQLSSLEEAAANKAIKGDAGAQTEIDLLCKNHPTEKLSLFCEKCEVLTCRDCQLQKHQEHKYHFLQDAADTYKLKLKGSVALMKERRSNLEKCRKEIEDRLEGVVKDKGNLQEEILTQANVVVKAVRTTMWSILSSLHSFTEAASKRLSREVGDVGTLVGKFDHCINFMEAILDNGQGTALLSSKAFVEAKCRKVYHTQMEPQSLKGQLKLQYRHDVPAFIKFLPNFGAIYVNGSKYPPEKTATQQNTTVHSGSGTAAASDKSGGGCMKLAVSVTGQAGSSMNLVVPHASTTPRLVTQPVSGWPTTQIGGQNSRVSVMLPLGMMGPIPAQTQRMILPHPSSSSSTSMSSTSSSLHIPLMTMKLHEYKPGSTAHISRGPPPYPGTGDSSVPSGGSQTAMSLSSGSRRSGTNLNPSPDPARPASEGCDIPDRPLPSDGAASTGHMKLELLNGKDCLLSADRLRSRKSSHLVAATLGEMQRNLDDVIRSVPLDMSDHLQPISACHSLMEFGGTSMAPTTSTPNITASTTPTTVCSTTSSLPSSLMLMAAVSKPVESAAVALEVPETVLGSAEGERNGVHCDEIAQVSALAASDCSQKTKSHAIRAQHGSTPVASPGPWGTVGDPNDDYCAACHQGGDVLCCDSCPRVFHLQCHIPVLSVVPSGIFNCTLCEDVAELEAAEEGPAEAVGGKRKAPTGLSDRELKVCERMLLELFCHPSSLPFHEPVNKAVPNYYKIIVNPMDFTSIKCKLSRSHFNHYATVESFLDDCKLIFKNCAIYNAVTSEVGKAGKQVQEFFEELVAKHIPHLSGYVSRQDVSECGESERKRRKVTSPSVTCSSHGKTK